MMKKFLSGVLVSALVLGTVSVVNPTTAEAVSVPKPAYTFDMNKANKNVVAVARKGDTSSMKPADVTKGGVMPTEAAAKGIKLKYVKGKHGKALYLDRSKSYGAQLKGVNLGSGSWSVSFWVKIPNGMGDFSAVFFAGTDLTEKGAKWVSITQRRDLGDIGSPIIWSRDAKAVYDNNKGEFPWYCKNGADKNGEAKWVKGTAFDTKNWVHVVLTVNTKKEGVYSEKGSEGYTKSAQAFTYINGKAYGNGAVSKGAINSKTKYFLGLNGWDIPMKAYYDDVKIWKKALTAKQVKALYKADK